MLRLFSSYFFLLSALKIYKTEKFVTFVRDKRWQKKNNKSVMNDGYKERIWKQNSSDVILLLLVYSCYHYTTVIQPILHLHSYSEPSVISSHSLHFQWNDSINKNKTANSISWSISEQYAFNTIFLICKKKE